MIIKRVLTKLNQSLINTSFYVIALAIFSINALWLAFTAIYPLPFDEYHHFGLIKIYASQWSPFITNQPAEAGLYGDITRLPSYFYHYLMSFPYRILDNFLDNETAIIISLRFINIILVFGAILIFRALFIRSGVSNKLVNIAVLFFVLTPIVPFLAAHINYDNLLILLSALIFYITYRLINESELSFRLVAWFIAIGTTACLVKYTFLLIFIPLTAFTVATLLNKHQKQLVKKLIINAKRQQPLNRLLLVLFLLVSMGLFTERIGINVIKYGHPEPSCEKNQPVEVCERNMPWYRNQQAKINDQYQEREFGNAISYTQHWVTKMMRGYFAIFSHTPTRVVSEREPFGPIVIRPLVPLPIAVAYTITVLFLIGLIMGGWRKIINNKLMTVITYTALFYVLILWLFNYSSYLSIGKAYAIQARYTYPLLLPLFVVFSVGLSSLKLANHLKQALVGVGIVIYMYSSGIAGWIIRSDPLWYWQNPRVITTNQKVQSVLKKFIWH